MLLHLLIPLPLPLLEEREEASALLVCGHGREKWWHRERKVEGLEKAEAARWNGGRVSSSLHLMSSARWHSVSMGAEILLQLWSCTQGWGGGWPTCLVCIEKICLSLPSQKAQGLRDSLLMPQHPTRQGAEKHWEVEGRCSICLLSPISEWQSPGDLKVTSQKRAMFTKQSQWQRCQRPHHFTFLLRMLSILAPCPRDRKIPLGHWFAMNTTARHQGHRSP